MDVKAGNGRRGRGRAMVEALKVEVSNMTGEKDLLAEKIATRRAEVSEIRRQREEEKLRARRSVLRSSRQAERVKRIIAALPEEVDPKREERKREEAEKYKRRDEEELENAEREEKLQQLGKFKFADLATWMLNTMWPKEKDAHAEEQWNFVAMFSEFEIENHAEGCDLNEMGMHRVFEWMDKHQTMQEIRVHIRKVGIESLKRISMIHFLVFNYGYDWV